MADALVRYQLRHGFAELMLDSPHNRNALSTQLVTELRQGLDRAAAESEARGVILTHSGTTFCSGADLSEALGSSSAVSPQTGTQSLVGALRAILELPKPVVARVDGHVRAGGMGVVAACDIAVAGPDSSFAITEARVGVAPFIVSLVLLPRLTARSVGRYFLTGERFDAAEAQHMGLVTMAATDTAAEVQRLCEQLVRGSPTGLAESKRLTNAAVLADFDQRAQHLATLSHNAFQTPEAVEGMTAFRQRRPPSWVQPQIQPR